MKTSDFLSFAHIISKDESQTEAQFFLQSLGENKTGYRAEKKFFFHRWIHQEKSTFAYTAFFALLKMSAMQRHAGSLPINDHFHVMLLLLNAMAPS